MAGAVAAFAFALFFAVGWGVASAQRRRRRGYGLGGGATRPTPGFGGTRAAAPAAAAPMGVEQARQVAAEPMPSAAQLEAAAQTLARNGAAAEAEEVRDRAAAAAAADELIRQAELPFAPVDVAPPPTAPVAVATPPSTPVDVVPAQPTRPPSEAGPATSEDIMRAAAAIAVPGYDPARARNLAPALNAELRRLGSGDRNTRSRRQTGATLALLESFARAAFGDAYVEGQKANTRTRTNPQGLVPYGGGIRGALVYYGIANPPATLVRPFETFPYSPPEGPAAATAGARRRAR